MSINIVKSGDDTHKYSERYLAFAAWMKMNNKKPMTNSQSSLAQYLLTAIGDKKSIFDNVEEFTRDELRKNLKRKNE